MDSAFRPPPPDVFASLRSFQTSGSFCDVSLRIPSSSVCVNAHRVVLAAASPYLAQKLIDVNDDGVFWLPEAVDVNVLAFIMAWIYGHPSQICKNRDEANRLFLKNLLVGADILQLTDLKNFIEHIKAFQDEEMDPDPLDGEVNTSADVFQDSGPGCSVVDKNKEEESLESATTYITSCVAENPTPNINDDDIKPDLADTESGSIKDSSNSDTSIPRKRKRKRTVYSRLPRLKRFQWNHTEWPCEKCGENFRRPYLPAHQRACLSGDAPPKLNRPSHDPVIKEHTVDGIFSCAHCDFRLGNATPYFVRLCASHLYKEHRVRCPLASFPCLENNCDFVCFCKSQLKKHSEVRHSTVVVPKIKVNCEFCGVSMQKNSLKSHIYYKHGDDGKHPCSVCGKVFRNPSYLNTHVKSHEMPAKEKDFKCKDCAFATSCRRTWMHHCYASHGVLQGDGQVFQCPDCDYKSPVKFRVTSHGRKSHPDATQKSVCPDCGKTFAHRTSLEHHARRVHSNADVTNCSLCGQSFRSKSAFKYHRWRVHHLGKNGAVEDDVEVRIDKPFKCAYCDHACGLSGNVLKHMRKKHPGRPLRYVDLRAEMKKNTVRGSESPAPQIKTSLELID